MPYGRLADMSLAKELQIDDYDNCLPCRKCGAMVRAHARARSGANEPEDSLWCRACLGTRVGASTAKEKRRAQAASGCKKLDSVFGRRQ